MVQGSKLNRLTVASLLLAASVNAQQAAQFTIIYTSTNGTVAPQYREVRQITVRSSDDSEIDVTTGVDEPGKKEWRASFVPSSAKLAALVDYIRSNHLDSPLPPEDGTSAPAWRPGDGTCNLYIAWQGDGHGLSCFGRARALPDMIRSLVPSSLELQRTSR